ncbi:hypothetical protein EI94DRAFT_1746677 [Lactarius quietus]|nr:hypothetical protein EI94DRAFT_1746677 [Lactarius quietus]
MLYPLLTFTFYQVLINSARAQVSAPNCTDSSFAWSYNSLHQNPCLVAAYLAAVCNNGAFVIPALLPQNSYAGPTGTDDADLCKCNTVVYNLINACDACQGSPWLPYSDWTSNCTVKASPGTFPEPVPAGTRVPLWAYIDTSIGDNWNISMAKSIGDSPEVTGTSSIIPTSTSGNSPSTFTPGLTGSGSLPNSSSHHSSDAGAVAGGVIGAIACVGLIAGAVAWYRRRQRGHSAPSSAYRSLQDNEMAHPDPFPITIDPSKPYDPNDPMTHPGNLYTAPSLPRSSSLSYTTASYMQPSEVGFYTGLPEI